MEYSCSACHAVFSADSEPHACPRCRAEAGLEARHGVPIPMKLFGVLLVTVLVASVTGGVLGMLAGS